MDEDSARLLDVVVKVAPAAGVRQRVDQPGAIERGRISWGHAPARTDRTLAWRPEELNTCGTIEVVEQVSHSVHDVIMGLSALFHGASALFAKASRAGHRRVVGSMRMTSADTRYAVFFSGIIVAK
jgi:hypothetical protein